MARTPKFRTVARGIAVAALAGLASTTFVGSASAAETATTIDTYSDWNGTDYIFEFGQPDTSTYGQVITVPDGTKKVKWVSFWMAGSTGAGDIVTRGEVYTWTGAMAGDLIAETKKPKVVKSDAADPEFYKVKYKFKKGKKLTPGTQIVVFASISKDYETTDPGVLNKWAANFFDALPGGDFVYLNDAGDESMWTTANWGVFTGMDLAFKAKLK